MCGVDRRVFDFLESSNEFSKPALDDLTARRVRFLDRLIAEAEMNEFWSLVAVLHAFTACLVAGCDLAIAIDCIDSAVKRSSGALGVAFDELSVRGGNKK